MSDDDLSGVKALYLDADGREIGRDYWNAPPTVAHAELRLLELLSVYETLALPDQMPRKRSRAQQPSDYENSLKRALDQTHDVVRDVRAGAVSPSLAIRWADRAILQAVKGFSMKWVREREEERLRRINYGKLDLSEADADSFKAREAEMRAGTLTFGAFCEGIGIGRSDSKRKRLKDSVRAYHPDVADLLPTGPGCPRNTKQKARTARPIKGLNPNLI